MVIGSGATRECRPKCYEIAAFQVTEHFRLPTVHAEQVSGAGHVDIEEGTAHQEVGSLGRNILGKLRQALRGDDTGKAALSATAHQIGHGAERHLARIFGDVAAHGRCKHLGLVDHDKNRIPEFAIGIEHAVEEGSGGAHLLLDIQPLQRQYAGNTMLPNAVGDTGKLGLGTLAIDDDVAEFIGQRHEIAFGIDDDLLHPLR
jgi:hypothetical protein